MKKPVLYLHRDEDHRTAVHQGRHLGVVAASDMQLEDALRLGRAAYPDYDVRVWAWEAPKRDSIDQPVNRYRTPIPVLALRALPAAERQR